MAPSKRLFVFDFDWTLIDADSDYFTFEHLNAELSKIQLDSIGKVQWTDLQQRLLGELFDRGVSRENIERTLCSIPFAPERIEALTMMKEQGSDLYILSDANTVYIETILKGYKIDHLFTGILTNPAQFDTCGRLNVKRFHGLDQEPHRCPLPCEPNLCKGLELQKLINAQDYTQVIYMGDGSNDFCPSTKLLRNRHDLVLARRGFPLEHRIKERPELVQAEVVYWETAQDMLEITKMIFGKRKEEEESMVVSMGSSLVSSAASSTTSLSTMVDTIATRATSDNNSHDGKEIVVVVSCVEENKTCLDSSPLKTSRLTIESSDSKIFAQTIKA
ncbi:hypothetical protein FBU30_002740 [Linnemannia zychae]|nr:hypothetical protein FBU30_002740 [Linnemannia zychae]